MQLPDIGGEWANVAINNVLTSMTAVTNVISALSGVRSRVLGLLHAFVSSVYYQREFESLAEGTFDRYKKGVDVLIAEGAERS
ncbi:MAG: hypothetical protein QOF41_662 [Methylobacteriaceae bacterium]|nr:hypothetical protein [Methylobacteriaceae bacterium]